jgi:hypothetical protein
MAWLTPNRIVGVEETGIFVVDPVARRLVSARPTEGLVLGVGRTATALVLLLAPDDGIGTARLATLDADGAYRTVDLRRTAAGYRYPTEGDPVGEERVPGLAIDAGGGHAYAVGAGEPVADIDLRSLTVSYHELSRPISLFGRLRNWLEPKAEAKGPLLGSMRRALWLGNGVVAVFGTDDEGTIDAAGRPQLTETPSGLQLVNTHDWSVRTLDPGADAAEVAQGALLTTGMVWRSDTQTLTGTGLTIFGADGAVRAHLFGSRPLIFQTVGPWALVPFAPPATTGYDVVDVRSGRVVTTIPDREPPFVLAGQAAPY